MTRLVISPMDDIAKRYGEQLAALGDDKRTRRVIARAANYEGRKAYTAVKRAVRDQSSIPNAIVQRSMGFQQASTGFKGGAAGAATEVAIYGKGRELSLKVFGPRQQKEGVRAKVWGRMKMHKGAFMGPRPGSLALSLKGHAFAREGKSRKPIRKLFGPSIPKEMVKDKSKEAFYAAAPRIVDRVGKEIAAVLRGYG